MQPTAPVDFLDVSRMLESSRPLPRINLTWWLGGGVVLLLLISLLIGNKTPASQAVVSAVWGIGMLVLVAGVSAYSIYTLKRFRADQRRVEQIGDLVQLRRWQDASVAVAQYLSSPARNHAFRAQALLYLSSVLARLQRFSDAIAVQTQLLEEGMLDEPSAVTVRMGRAMAMLREDHLVDADRAISELRRGPAGGSAPVSLIEIYRDVRTGHPLEAIEIFEAKLTLLRDQLGHRLADAYALAARAYDLLGREPEAAAAFKNATLLSPMAELFRRYPEVEKLKGRYEPAPAPPEAR